MNWEVSGADRKSGAERKIIVEAETEDSARRRASRQDLMVADVRALDSNDSAVQPAIAVAPAAAPMARKEGLPVESTVFTTRLNPLRLFLGPVLFLLFAFIAAVIVGALSHRFAPAACIFAAGLLNLFVALARYLSSRYRITNQRISIQRGLVSRKSYELLLSKVESISVEQSVMDRLLRCGTLVIHGTGGSREVFPGIHRAEKFRKIASESIERYSRR